MSLPSRERGLKLQRLCRVQRVLAVAPFTGAWIEIPPPPTQSTARRSLPSRERGLKFFDVLLALCKLNVAPFTGAWIEILDLHAMAQTHGSRSLHGSVD